MMKLSRFAAAAALALALASPALAQTYRDTGGTSVPGVVVVDPTDNSGPLFSTSNPGHVSGTFSASFSGFTPTPAYAQLSVGVSSTRVALPSGNVVIVYNTGANAAFVQLGGAGVVATSNNDVIQPGSWLAFTVGSATYLAGIETAGATTLNISGGAGLPTGAGGGSSGSGSVPTGSAGSPNAAVVSVQGIASMTPLKVDGSGVTQPVSLASFPALAAGAATIGSIANTSFAATESGTWTVQPGNTANTTAWLVTGAGGTFPATESGTWNITNISGTVSLPTGAATSANQTNASQKTQIVDGSGNVIASTSNNLNVQCANCSGSGVSTADGATFTAGSSLFAGIGGFTQTTPTSNPLTNGKQGFAQLTPYRALMTDWYNSSGTEMGTSGSPVQVSLANTGTNTTALKVDGSAVTQPVSGSVTANAGTNLNTSTLALEAGGNLASVKTDADNLNLAQGSTTSGQKGNLVFAATTTGAPSYTTAQSNPLSLTTSGGLRVDGSGVTQPVSVASLPLPSGAATAANQTTINTTLGTLATDAHLTTFTTANHTDLAQLHTDLTGPIPGQTSGAAVGIGGMKLCDQASSASPLTPCATITGSNAVKVDGSAVTQPVSIATAPVLVAGSAIIGKIGIDQTTDGTTNKVAPEAAVGAATFGVNVVSVGTGATLISAARTGVPGTGRVSITVVNTAQTVSLCIGPTSGVTTSNGMCLPAVAGASITLNTTSAVYGVWGDAGTHNVSFAETY